MSVTNSDLLEIAGKVSRHEWTARQVVDAAIERGTQFQERFRPFTLLTPDLARQHAEQVERRLAKGESLPLAGVPFAVKDLFDVQGTATTYGSKVFADRIAGSHATCVQRLLDAGACLIGKLNLHECAFGFTGENKTFGNCKNPWNEERVAGGSSSGSAVAVALNICPFTLGSDTGGSIRQPSALCGLTGLKPTFGLVSKFGGLPLAWSLDHVGPITRSARDAAVLLSILAGHDPEDPHTRVESPPKYEAGLDQPLKGLRIGVPREWFFADMEPDVAKAVEQGMQELKQLGATLTEVRLSHLEEVVGAHRAIIFAEAAEFHRPWLAERSQDYADDIRPLLQGGTFVSAVDYLHAQRVRRVILKHWNAVFQNIDCLLTPTTPVVATKFGQKTARLGNKDKPLVRAYLDLTLPFNLSGHPAVSIPCGFSSDGLPIGMQIVGKYFDEGTILRVAHQYQLVTQWHQKVPPAANA